MARLDVYCSKIYISGRFDVAVAKSPLHKLLELRKVTCENAGSLGVRYTSESGDKANAFASGWAKLKSSLFDMDSLESVEILIAIEETFDVTISDSEAEAMATPRDVVVWLWPRVSNKEPNEVARRLLQGQGTGVWQQE